MRTASGGGVVGKRAGYIFGWDLLRTPRQASGRHSACHCSMSGLPALQWRTCRLVSFLRTPLLFFCFAVFLPLLRRVSRFGHLVYSWLSGATRCRVNCSHQTLSNSSCVLGPTAVHPRSAAPHSPPHQQKAVRLQTHKAAPTSELPPPWRSPSCTPLRLAGLWPGMRPPPPTPPAVCHLHPHAWPASGMIASQRPYPDGRGWVRRNFILSWMPWRQMAWL